MKKAFFADVPAGAARAWSRGGVTDAELLESRACGHRGAFFIGSVGSKTGLRLVLREIARRRPELLIFRTASPGLLRLAERHGATVGAREPGGNQLRLIADKPALEHLCRRLAA